MYLPFFGLNEKPFAITPDPRYLFLSERHSEALAHLLYGITEAGGFVQLTGEVGTGKTTTIRSLLAQTPKNAEVALILNPRISAPEFLLTICEELGVGVPDSAVGSVKELVDILNSYLLRAHSQGKRVVLVVDEAQNLAPEVLEQVRLLTNLETETQKLLQIILIGQPELRDILDRVELRQLAQRVTGRYHLDPLSADESASYVRHRLRVAGATSDIFSPAALRETYRLSRGVPRLINVISDRALLGAYTQDRHRVTPAIVRRAATEVFDRPIAPAWLPWAFGGAGVLAALLTAFLLWRVFGATDAANDSAATAALAAETAADAAVAAPGAEPLPTPAPAPGTARIEDLLQRFATETDGDNAFNKLFALWDARYVVGDIAPCAQAQQQGLACLAQRGTLAELLQFNRPAILILRDATGTDHQVVLAALAEDKAALSLGGTLREVPLADLSRAWFGDYVLLWRAGRDEPKPLEPGARGVAVQRLQQSLRASGNVPAQPANGVYDAELMRLVAEFQRRHRLEPDGIADIPTQVMIDSALPAESPRLVSAPAAVPEPAPNAAASPPTPQPGA
jgi:general secretion pathway protein A